MKAETTIYAKPRLSVATNVWEEEAD